MDAANEDNFEAVLYLAIQHIVSPANVEAKYAAVLARIKTEVTLAAARGLTITKFQGFKRDFIHHWTGSITYLLNRSLPFTPKPLTNINLI